jgi:AraC family transcriptional activator of pobA
MEIMKITSVEEFYKETAAFMPEGISKEIGHFNVFKVEDIVEKYKVKPFMPYNRRAYYKISFIDGKNIAEYADKVIDIEKYALASDCLTTSAA